jgi:hypothetical protein
LTSGGTRQLQPGSGAEDAPDGGWRLTAHILIGALVLSPLLWARVPPLVDYPNHLARMWILVHDGKIPQLAANYRIDWRILPDLAMDAVVPQLSRLMPVEQAGRVFLALTMLSLVGGTATLHRVLYRQWRIWPLCSALFVYNAALFWGFVNCLFATGVYLFAFSGWIATDSWRKDFRALSFSLVASVLVLLHLFAFGLYALSLFAYELGRCLGRGAAPRSSCCSLAFALLQLVPGIALWYASLARGGYTLTVYGGLPAKLYAVLAPFTFGVEPVALDSLGAATICAALIMAILSRSLRLAPEMRLPLVAMIAAAVLMPNRMSGSWSADIRLPVALPFVIIAGIRLEIDGKRRAAVAAAAMVLLSLRVWSVSISWRDYDRWFTEFRTASAAITPGARLLVIQSPIAEDRRRLGGLPRSFGTLQPVVFTHLAALGVIDRAVFFPYLFTGWTPIDTTPRNAPISQREAVPATPDQLIKGADPKAANYARFVAAQTDVHGELPYWRDWPDHFDFALWIDFGGARRFALRRLEPLRGGSFFEIYRVVRSSERRSPEPQSGVRPG